jgi:photosystem II stability/assembly factor-like uncharacterized protein
MSKLSATALLALALLVQAPAAAETSSDTKPEAEKKEEGPLSSATFAGLELRSIGPALPSGRIADLAIDPTDDKVWWIATASGGVWKTTNAGTTWTPVFDGETSYSTGAIAIDPKNPNVVWVGTGENNNQRSVAFGDGVYKTVDGGKSWKRMGLEQSEHIGKIVVDPRDSDTVWVAAQGPLWSSGGERGLYKTTDGGATWSQALRISDDTGVTDFLLDPRDPDTVLAAAHQRRRHVWTFVSGGPESGLHKSTDGGKSWRKLTSGLPKGDLGRIGLALSPQNPDVVYAILEAEGDGSGFYRSLDRGESWEKRGDHSTSGNYYTEIVADPHQEGRIYSMDTFLQVSDDGGKTFANLGEKAKHVDNHVIWVDPRDAAHYLVGSDGGLYESFDRGATWRYFENLPIVQYYRVAVGNEWPVYSVCGGTQDNNSHCGPARTLRFQGPANEDWTVTQGGDGFWTAVDPTNPDIVYAEAQYGVLTRFDRKSGENVDIQPQPGAGEPPLRWNWNAPLVLSPHSPTRLYFAANKLFRSDDRGDHWRAVSGDLTRQLDRNLLPVFGKIQRPEAVGKHASTSFYGNIVALAESPKVEGLLYVGTDDGLVQVSENGGADWRRIERFPGVPARTYVSRLLASRHEADLVYAAFDNHKLGDFRPYLLKSTDRGRSWKSIAGDLPERGHVHALAEDPANPKLLFAGTEFGLFFTLDGGGKWIQLKGGLPTIAVADLAFQERENDLALATFGRGFYLLDDVTPLRALDAAALEARALLFQPEKAWLYQPSSRIGDREKAFLGETFYTAANPPFGAVFTWYLKEEWKSRKDARQEAEKKRLEQNETIDYPRLEALRAESREEEAKLLFTIQDASGEVVRRLEAKPKKGIQRMAWDLRYPPANPARKGGGERPSYLPPPQGPFVAPGSYAVRVELVAGGKTEPLAGPVSFEVDVLANATLPARDRAAVLDFQRKTARLQRAALGAQRLVGELEERLELIRIAIDDTPALDPGFDRRARDLQLELEEVSIALSGDEFLSERNENQPPSIVERIQSVVYSSWYSSAEPTGTQRDAYRIAGAAFERALDRLRALRDQQLAALETELEQAGAPWTPGRLPSWTPEP